MNQSIVAFLSAVLLGISVIGTASADEYGGKSYFESYDQNHDGVVSKEELGPRESEFLSKYDENKDGQLNAAEFSAFEKSEDWMSPVTGPGGVQITEPYEQERKE